MVLTGYFSEARVIQNRAQRDWLGVRGVDKADMILKGYLRARASIESNTFFGYSDRSEVCDQPIDSEVAVAIVARPTIRILVYRSPSPRRHGTYILVQQIDADAPGYAFICA